MRKRLALYGLLTMLAVGLVIASSDLVLQDGRIVTGIEVRRDGDNYLVTLAGGETIVIPAVLVKAVRLEGTKPDKPRVLAGQPPPDGPSGIVTDAPKQLAGNPAKPPSTRDQTAALGEPSKFQKNIIDPSWTPTTDWNMNPEEQNNFAPSTWSKSIIDPSWKPESAWDPNEDVLADSRSSFQKSIVDNKWTPTDGFAK